MQKKIKILIQFENHQIPKISRNLKNLPGISIDKLFLHFSKKTHWFKKFHKKFRNHKIFSIHYLKEKEFNIIFIVFPQIRNSLHKTKWFEG